jgi:cholesterol oxidase
MWPNKGEKDERPIQNEKYLRIPFIKPNKPVVPVGAIGELRIDKVAP